MTLPYLATFTLTASAILSLSAFPFIAAWKFRAAKIILGFAVSGLAIGAGLVVAAFLTLGVV